MTDNEVYESNLQHFTISKRYRDKTQCRCPAHNDKQASLTITKGRKCTLFHCHAGCTLEDVLSAAGLMKKDTFYDAEPQRTNCSLGVKWIIIVFCKHLQGFCFCSCISNCNHILNLFVFFLIIVPAYRFSHLIRSSSFAGKFYNASVSVG